MSDDTRVRISILWDSEDVEFKLMQAGVEIMARASHEGLSTDAVWRVMTYLQSRAQGMMDRQKQESEE